MVELQRELIGMKALYQTKASHLVDYKSMDMVYYTGKQVIEE